MIKVYPSGASDFSDGALCILFPTVCTVKKTAAAEWSLHLEMPVDFEDSRWKTLKIMNIIKAPVLPETLPAISAQGNITGTDYFDVYVLTSASQRYADPGGAGQRPVKYSAFQGGHYYYSGDKVTYGGQNYQATTSFLVYTFSSGSWKKISNYTNYTIAPKPAESSLTPSGTEIKLLDIVTVGTTDYLYGTTMPSGGGTPVTGYWLLSTANYSRTQSSGSSSDADIKARTITEQCFRINSVQNDGKTISVDAMHLSYDYKGMPMYLPCSVENKSVTQTVAAILAARVGIGLNNNRDANIPLIACQPTGIKITADYTNQNLIYCLLDPDEGIVSQAKARLLRDNWNFYLLTNSTIDRGFRIEYGGNMRGVDWSIDASDLITAIIPTGKQENDETLYLDLPNDGPVLFSKNWTAYPYHPTEMLPTGLKVGTDGTTAEVRTKMQSEAQDRFDHDHVDQPRESVKVQFLLLGDTEEYAQYKGLQRVSLYDTVHVYHPDIDLECDLQVIGYEYDSLRERLNSVTVGDVIRYPRQTVAGYQIKDKSITAAKLRT